MIYGRFKSKTLAEVHELEDFPFLIFNGHHYRITELHETVLGVNYQAQECDPREIAASRVPVEEEAAEPTPVQEPVSAVALDETLNVPPFLQWAREHGWKGIGRIPYAVRAAYEAEYGAAVG